MKVTLTLDDIRKFFAWELEYINELEKHYIKMNSVNSVEYKRECLRTVRDQKSFLEAQRRRFEVFALMYGKEEGGED